MVKNYIIAMGVGGVHMTATCGQFWSITQKALNYPDGVFLVSP